MGQFYGFKASEGVDQFPNDYIGPQWMFMHGKRAFYSSSACTEAAMVTGAYHSVSLTQFLTESKWLNSYLNLEIREQKMKGGLSETEIVEKHKLIRLGFFSIFGRFRDREPTDSELNALLSHPQFYEYMAKVQKLVNKNHRNSSVEVKTSLAKEILKSVIVSTCEWCRKYEFMQQSIITQKTLEMRDTGKLPEYIELRHTASSDLFLIE